MTQRHLVVMAAGTGGHVFPGLAVAREVQRRGWSVSWLGTRSGMENRLVPPTGIALDAIGFSGLRGKGVLGGVTGGVRLLKAFWDCLRILRSRGTSAVLGMGGYVCFPGGLMASLLGKPLVLVNADASLLLSTRSLLPVADAVASASTGPLRRRPNTRWSPATRCAPRSRTCRCRRERFLGRNGPLSVLVVGGSLGARVLNETMPAALSRLDPAQRPYVVHQTGVAAPRRRACHLCDACACRPRSCRSSTTCRRAWPRAT